MWDGDVEVSVGVSVAVSVGVTVQVSVTVSVAVSVPVVSASQVPTSPSFGIAGSPVPPPPQNKTDYWVQGINLGLAFRY